MGDRLLKRPRDDSESIESSSSSQSGSSERLKRMRRENGLVMQDTESSQKIKDDNQKKTASEFLTLEEHKSINNGLWKNPSQRNMKEAIAVKIYKMVSKCIEDNEQNSFIKDVLIEVRKNDLYKQAYGSEGPSSGAAEKRHHILMDTAQCSVISRQQDQIEQQQYTTTQQHEGQNQAGPSRQDGASNKRPLSVDSNLPPGQADSMREYTLIDFAKEALSLDDPKGNIPLDKDMLRFTVSHPFTGAKYDSIRFHLRNNGVYTPQDIERKMHRVYRYNLTANEIRRSSRYNAAANKMRNTDQQ
jgi:hypothetical protein